MPTTFDAYWSPPEKVLKPGLVSTENELPGKVWAEHGFEAEM